MEVDSAMAAERAREIAAEKTRRQFPWPHHEFDKRQFFAKEASRAFCDMVLQGGYAQLTAFDGSGDANG